MLTDGNIESLCRGHIFYNHESGIAVITFVLPAACDELPDSAYVGCFTHATKLIMMVNPQGYIVDANEKLNSTFNLKKVQ